MGFFFMQENTIETLERVVDTTLEKPFTISVNIEHVGRIERLLQSWGIKPKQRVFELTPITLGNMIRISKLLLRIDEKILDKENLLDSNYQILSDHGEKLAEIIAIAISNNKIGPSESLIKLVKEEFTPKIMLRTFAEIIMQMNVKDFMHSIILVRGFNVLEKKES